MAQFEIFSVLDRAVGAFMQPFFARSRGEALRSFSDAVNNSKMEFGNHPDDYALFVFGKWDDKGEISLLTSGQEKLAEARDLAQAFNTPS